MAKTYDDEEGVWRTIGGRRVFIRSGQSLADAMIESGKFKTGLRSNYRKAKQEDEEKKKAEQVKNINVDDAINEFVNADVGDWNNMNQAERDKTCEKILKDFEQKYGDKLEDEKFRKEVLDGLEDQNFHTMGKIIDEKYEYSNNKELKDLDKRIAEAEKKEEKSNIWEKQEDGSFKANKDAMKKDYEERHKRYDAKIAQFAEDRKNMTNSDWEASIMAYEKQNADGTYNTFGDIYEDIEEYERQKSGNINNEYTKQELKDKFGTDNLDIINAGRSTERRVNLKEEPFVQKSTSPFYPDKEYSQEQLKKMVDNGIKPMENSYSGNGWEGLNSNKHLSTKEQAKAVTDAMKSKYPDVKIARKSDVYSGGSSIDFNIMSSDKDLFVSDAEIDKMGDNRDFDKMTSTYEFERWAKDNVKDYETKHSYTLEDQKKYAKESLNNLKKRDVQSVRGDEWYLSDYGKKVVSDLNKEANSYTYSDNDAMTDYFDHGTYMWVNIGKWDKPYQVNESKGNINDSLRRKGYQKYLKEHPGSKITFEEYQSKK